MTTDVRNYCRISGVHPEPEEGERYCKDCRSTMEVLDLRPGFSRGVPKVSADEMRIPEKISLPLPQKIDLPRSISLVEAADRIVRGLGRLSRAVVR